MKTIVRNKDLYKVCKDFIYVVCKKLRAISLFENINIIESPRFITEEDKYLLSFREEPCFWKFAHERSTEVEGLSEFKKCIKFMQKDDAVIKHFHELIDSIDSSPELQWIRNNLAYPLLIEYVTASKSFNFRAAIFDRVYKEMERCVYSPYIDYVVFAPLYNFKIEPDVIELENDIKIRKVKLEELNKLIETGYMRKHLYISKKPYFVLATHYKGRKNFVVEYEKLTPLYSDMITILRLFKPGWLGYLGYFVQPQNSWAGGTLSHGEPLPFLSIWEEERQPYYIIDSAEIRRLKKFWNLYRNLLSQDILNKHEYMKIALKRFNSAISGSNTEDQIIDSMIALESLYLQDEKELGHKLSLRVSILLGKNDSDRSFIRDLTKKGYEVRSKIVHGKEVKQPVVVGSKKYILRDMALEIENLLRISIKKFLILCKRYIEQKEILDDLDSALINDEYRKKLKEKLKLK